MALSAENSKNGFVMLRAQQHKRMQATQRLIVFTLVSAIMAGDLLAPGQLGFGVRNASEGGVSVGW